MMGKSIEEQIGIITKGADEGHPFKAIPEDIPELVIDWEKDKLIDVIPSLVQQSLVASNSEFRKLVEQGGVQLNGEKIEDLDYVLVTNDVLRIGKKKFVRIIK